MKLSLQRTLTLTLVLISTGLTNCAKGQATDSTSYEVDNSASGSAAGAVGGALTNSTGAGTQAMMKFQLPSSLIASLQNALSPMPKASAAGFCPTSHITGADCTTTGKNMWLTYNSCTFTGAAEWNGVQELTMTTNNAACGTFPNPGAGGILYRQFVQAAGASNAGQITLTSNHATGLIDDAVANLGNFDNQVIAAINPNTGYGASVTFDGSGARSQIEIGHHIAVTGSFDHSVSGTLTITESSPNTSRTVNGSVTVYHNLVRVVGTSVFDQVQHENICCLPTKGTITTTFTAGQNVSPTVLGALLVGKSEIMTFTGCGTATLKKADGTTVNVTMNRCF